MADDELRDDDRDPRYEDERTADRPRASNPADRLRPGRQDVLDDDEEEQNEEQLWQGSYSGKAMVGSWLLAGALSLGLLAGSVFFPPMLIPALVLILLIWLGFAGLYLYRRWSVSYELTTQRFLHREGILSRRTERIEIIDMDDITCTQGIVERIMGVGTIKISSSDRTHPVLMLRGIEDANDVADIIDKIRRKERRRRGLHIESI